MVAAEQTQYEPSQERGRAVADAEHSGWHKLTVLLLGGGYAGFYLCRSVYSVLLPSLHAELTMHGLAPSAATLLLGSIASAGMLAYAFGKPISGILADTLGGKRIFLGGMAGSALFTALLAAAGSSIPFFAAAWVPNRLFQSGGWPGIVKVSSRWFSPRSHGMVISLISMGFLVGDTLSRYIASLMLQAGLNWRMILLAFSGTLSFLLIGNVLLLRETPRERALSHPQNAPDTLTRPHRPSSVAALLLPLCRESRFWIICGLSLGGTLLREAVSLWTPTYFVEVVGLSGAQAAGRSALAPFLGCLSVLLAGLLSDHFGARGRALTLMLGFLCATACFLALARLPARPSPWLPITLVTLVGAVIIGPYSYLAGTIALDVGGQQRAATAAGIIDGIGYLAGVLAGGALASIAVHFGWGAAFTLLGATSVFTGVLAIPLLFSHSRT